MRIALKPAAIVAAAVAIVVGGLTTGSNAHIGSTHSPYTTDVPDLVSVGLDGGDVDFCFDEEVVGQPTPGEFVLQGYDSALVSEGDSARLDPENKNCIQVNFAGDIENDQFSIGTARAGGTADRDGNDNIEGSASLTGSKVQGGAGRTTSPNLIDFDVNAGAGEITYTFDQDIECPLPANTVGFAVSFGYYTQAGQGGAGGRHDGTDTTDCDDNEATIQFKGGVAGLERVFVDSTSSQVCGFDADVGDGTCTGEEGEGTGDTDSPDLESAEITGDGEFTYTFDEDVTVNSEDYFFVYAEDGEDFFASAGDCTADNEEIECAIGALEDVPADQLVLAGVRDGAATDAADPTLQNTIGDAPLDDGLAAAGLTDGPDLESCAVSDAADGLVSFSFDENVTFGRLSDARKFDLFDVQGDLHDGSAIDDDLDNVVVVEFDPDDLTESVGCHLDAGGVQDFLTNLAPPASVGRADLGPPPAQECQEHPGAICGSDGNDNVQGTPGDDVIVGGDGNDHIDGMGGNDTIFGGEGNDTLDGGEGDDQVDGGPGDDTIIGGPGADGLIGGGGKDRIIGDALKSTRPSSNFGFTAAQTEAGPDTIDGGGGADSIEAGGGVDDVVGGEGQDQISGMGGGDKVHGGGDGDTVGGGGGADKLFGDKGNDKLKGDDGNDTLNGGDGVSVLNGGGGKDTCILNDKRDDTRSCENEKRNFKRNFFPYKPPA